MGKIENRISDLEKFLLNNEPIIVLAVNNDDIQEEMTINEMIESNSRFVKVIKDNGKNKDFDRLLKYIFDCIEKE